MKSVWVYFKEFPLEHRYSDDAGYDLRTTEDVTLHPGELKLISTGIHLAIPKGYYGQILGRSSLASKGIIVLGGVIDAGYRGEVKVILYNAGKQPITFKKGDAVAQIVLLKLFDGAIVHTTNFEDLPPSERGEKGFGSTGR